MCVEIMAVEVDTRPTCNMYSHDLFLIHSLTMMSEHNAAHNDIGQECWVQPLIKGLKGATSNFVYHHIGNIAGNDGKNPPRK